MTNVLSFARRSARPDGGLGALLAAFAHHRRRPGDAFWLKENAELLGILAATGRRLPDLQLAVYQPFHEGVEEQIAFHPQYYRMLLGLTLSLETLGFPGDKGRRLAEWIAAQGWIDSEVNDLQRAETRHLLALAGVEVDQPGLEARLLQFMSRPATFALPNPRAAYDLLHAIFYLTGYGRRPMELPAKARESLLHLGCLAHLEQNGDLLAEVLIALAYCNEPLPPLWLAMVLAERAEFRILPEECRDSADAYHNFLVNQWLLITIGDTAFCETFPAGPMRFSLNRSPISPMREWAQALQNMGEGRRADWARMRAACQGRVSETAMRVADAGAAGSPGFETFFAVFAREAGPAPAARNRVAG
ncbi:DUF6902 family protein [Gemmobacter denitrificans]|uniref:Uncharacterized protein n=1 Tax=Gemmobacter denitrificans TaxID=3123040 RepID=A0ABU8BQT4_9RHOB